MKRSLCVTGVLTLAAIVALAPAAHAHGTRPVAGLELTVGWANEPALAGQSNAVQLSIERDGEPVEGAEDTLRVTVSLGDESTDRLKLRTVFGSPGEYRTDLIPTVVGGYTFRFQGKIGAEDVDESFTSPEDGFDAVIGTSDIAFPKDAPTTTELAERLATVEDDADDAESAIVVPRSLAIVGIVLGAIAIVLALRRPRVPA